MSQKPSIALKPNGPLLVRDLENLKNSRSERIETEAVIALCRCGGSGKKPFCDGTHKKIGFSGQLPADNRDDKGGDDSAEGVEQHDSDLEPAIIVGKNGPYAVSGSIELLEVKFGKGVSREQYFLCRCGASENKPFCDGSHSKIEFRDEKN